MEKRGEGKKGIPVLALAKCLLVSYVLTLLLLCLLALLLYKLHVEVEAHLINLIPNKTKLHRKQKKKRKKHLLI